MSHDKLACPGCTQEGGRGTVLMAVGPATVAGVVPWLLTRWRVRDPVPGGTPARVVGALLVGSGVVVLTQSFVRFVTEGVGTRLR